MAKAAPRPKRKETPTIPAIFVHGVPETHHLWEGVRSRLSRKDTIAPDMPDFGCDAPPGYGNTKEEYVDWLIAECEKCDAPVDLVGHDWGALLVQRLVALRPDLVRTWTAGGGVVEESYVWHPVAQIWQTPGQGEAFIQQMTAAAMATALVNDGVPADVAQALASRIDERMKTAILKLYRSAVNYPKEWGPDMARVKTPGLLIFGGQDQYMQPEFARKLAAITGAELVLLPGGHWWPLQFPQEVAEHLERFWSSV